MPVIKATIMNKTATLCASLWFWFELFFTSALLFPVAFLIWIFTLPFDRRLVLLHRFSCQWSNLVFFLNPHWKVTISGRERINPATAYVMVSNHQSGADILVLFRMMVHFKWVSKWSLFWFPFIGWNMAMNRYIALKRGRKSSINRMVERCVREIRSGNSVMIFPEGTRSKDGKVHPFKSGAFRIALETGAPILPIAISGTITAIRKGGLLIHRNHDMKLMVLDPVDPAEYANHDQKSLAAKIHDLISRQISSGTVNPVPQESGPLHG